MAKPSRSMSPLPRAALWNGASPRLTQLPHRRFTIDWAIDSTIACRYWAGVVITGRGGRSHIRSTAASACSGSSRTTACGAVNGLSPAVWAGRAGPRAWKFPSSGSACAITDGGSMSPTTISVILSGRYHVFQ